MATWRTPEDLEQAKTEYGTKLALLDAPALRKESNQMIWLSAYANNNPRSDYHWQVDMVYDECKRRNNPEIYEQEHAKLLKEARGH